MGRAQPAHHGVLRTIAAIAIALAAAGCKVDNWRWPFIEYDKSITNPLGTADPALVEADPEADQLLTQADAPVVAKQELEGVVIEVLRDGQGDPIGVDDAAILRYRAVLSDGTVIDEATEPRGPWPLPGMVQGLRDGLAGARVGAVRRITVAPALAYGEEPARDPTTREVVVPPNATIVYTVHLVGVVPAAEPESE